MPNPFDQFDEPGTTATATANPFDQFDTAPQADPRAARRADLQAQQAAARSAGETTSFSARAAAGIEQGLRTPEAMVRGGLDALQYYRALDAVTGSGDRFQRQNEAELRAMRDRDAYLARETQAIEGRDGRNFVGDLVQGVARGVVELPPQLMAGAAGAMRGAAVQASAAMGGLQGGLSQYAQERGEGRSQLEALPPAVASGLITAVTTRAFGDTGIESVFRNEGTQGFRRRLLGVLKDAGMEGAEELVDQAQQDLLERVTRNPGKPLGESFYDTMQALAVGTVIGGAATAPRLIQRGDRPVIVNEQTGTTDFPPLEGDELPPPPPPAPPAGPANVPPPIRGEAAMETRPSASWTPDGPRTPAVDPELADAIAAIRAGYNPEVEAPVPAPAPPSTFSLQPLTLPDVPGVPPPLEGQPYDTALRTRPEATMESRPAAPLGLQREPTVSPELADTIQALRQDYQQQLDVPAEARAQSAASSIATPSRFRPRQAVEFSQPLVGPSGASLVAYEWKWTPVEEVDKRGEERIRRISNWEEAQSSAETGRDIVHQFQVKMPDGTVRMVSAESVPVVLGFAKSGSGAKLPTLVNASKTLAQLQMKLALLEQQEASNTEAMAKAKALPLPPITSEPAVATVGKDAGKPYGTRFKMGTDSWVLQREPGPITAERLETLVRSWQDARAKEFGWARPSERRVDLQNRIARQQKKLDAILQSQPTPPDQSGGPSAQPAQAATVGNSAIDAAIAALDAAKIKTQGIYTLPDLGLTVTLWNGSLDAAKLALRAGRSLAQAVEAGIDWLRAQGQRFDDARVRTALEQTVKADARIAATKARTVAGRTVGTSNPTTKRRSGEGTDPDHNVSLQRLRARNPEAYRKNALLLTRYPLVAREYPDLAERMRAIDSPYEAAEERYENAKEKLEQAKSRVEKALAGLLERKANSIKAAEVEAWMRSDPNSKLTVAVRNAQELVATRKAQRDEAADRRSERIDALAESKRLLPLEDADRIYESYIKVVESNLEALIKLASTTWRDTARLWYDGANLIAQDFARQFGATLEQAGAVLAVFSPQKDWFMNVALARRMMNIWQNDQNTRWSPEMTRQFIKRSGEPQPVEDKETGQFVTSPKLVSEWNPDGVKYDKGARPGPPDEDGNPTWLNWDNEKAAKNLERARELLKDLEGRTLAELKDTDLQARFIRMLSEVRDNPNYPKVTPDGQFGELMRNENGKVLKIAWGGYNTIEKAIAVMSSRLELKSGDVLTSEADVISAALGAQHKVRSFYNNIVDPANTSGHVTMDTHAIAALLWMPLSGASPEVTQNFGGAGTMNDGTLGIKGVYAANAEAYRRAAAAPYISLLPREVQSITWEAVRMLFPAKWKADKTNVAKVRDIWEQYRRNELTIDQARNAVFQLVFGRDLAGAIADDSGVGSPSWTGAMGDSSPDSQAAQGADDAGAVPTARGAWGPGSGRGAGSAGSVGGGGNPAAVVRPAAEGVVDSAIAALEAAKVKPGGLYALPDLGLTVTLWNGTLTAAQVALRAGRSLAQAVQAGVDWLRSQGQTFDEAEVRKALEQGLLQAPGIREHVGKRLLQEDFSPAAKAALEPLLRYEVKPDAQLFAEAAAVVEAIGPMEAEANYFGNPWGLPADAHVVLGFAIGNGLSTLEAQARAVGDTALADRIGRQNAEFQSQFVLQSTETARTLRAYRYFDLVGNLSPFTADLFARKVIEQASQKQKQRIKPALDKGPDGEPGLTDRLNEINRAGINEAARTPEVQGAARTAINQAIEEEARTAGTPVQQAIAAEVVAQLQTAGRLNAVEAAIVREHFGQNPEPLALADKLERAGVKPAKARAAELEGKYKDGVEAFRAKLRQKLAEARKKDIDPATLGIVDKAIRQRLAELQVKLGALVRQHWTEQERVGRTLAESLVQEAGLPEAQATRLADAIQRRFKALVQARKEQALRNLAKTPAARELQKPTVAQRIIEATNLGALDSEGLWQAVADKLGLPTYSDEASAEVKRLADRAQQLPEGSVQRQEATARLMRFIARQKNVNFADLGWAFWYANTLSGPITHAVNAFSNVLSLAGNVSTQFRDVRGIPQILAATAKGFRTGLTEARAIVKQGPGANRTKFTEQGQALENLDPQDFTGAGLVSQWRYVARALAAADAAFYFPAREAKAITLARALARQEGKTGAAIRTRAQQILDGTEEQQNLWGAQVDRERAQLVAMGEKPDALWTTRRLEQLREQGWGADIGEAADDFALRTTYNNRPYGFIGELAEAAKRFQRVPVLGRATIPFVNVVANVVNDSINYTPWGFARAYAAGRTGEPSVTLSLPFEWAEKLREGKSPMTPDAVVDLHAKAALGTAMVGSLMAMALAGLDDDDGENFQLYGSGPKDAAAKAALRETGWIPYSVRVNGTYVSFANTPLAIPLGALGHYLDAARYDKRFEQADAFNRLGVALWGGAHIITQQSFLDGLARLLGALEERRGRIDTASDRAVEQAFRSISSVAVPNALRQLDRLNDPKIYDARGIEGALVAAIPFARRAGSPALNAFGEPITSEPWKRFASDAEANVWADLARRKIYPSVAHKAKNANGREMTDDEHYRYVQESGQAIKRRLEQLNIRALSQTELEKEKKDIEREEHAKVRRRLGF